MSTSRHVLFAIWTVAVFFATTEASAQSLAFTQNSYTVGVGQTTTATIECALCVGAFNNVLQFSTFPAPSHITVSPVEVGPITTDTLRATVTIRGVSPGVTTLRCVLFSGASAVLNVDVAVSVVEGGTGGCPAQASLAPLKGGPAALSTLYRLRKALSANSTGKNYVDKYYRHAPEVTRILLRSPSLRKQFASAIRNNLGSIERVASGKPVMIRASELTSITTLASRIAYWGSASLKRDLYQLRGQLRRDEFLAQFGVSTQLSSFEVAGGRSASRPTLRSEEANSPRLMYRDGFQMGLTWARTDNRNALRRLESFRNQYSRDSWLRLFRKAIRDKDQTPAPSDRLFLVMHPGVERRESPLFWRGVAGDDRYKMEYWLRGFVQGALNKPAFTSPQVAPSVRSPRSSRSYN